MKTEKLSYDLDDATIVGKGGRVIAEVYGPEHYPCSDDDGYFEATEEQDEYGQLLAAAPDLYAACEEWLGWYDQTIRNATDGDDDVRANIVRKLHGDRAERTRAALAKARANET